MTAEKEKAPTEDREHINTKSSQILDALSKHDRFNELVQKGLKSMTLKHFIAILEFLLKPIIGAVPKDFHTNYVDFLHNILMELEYPYNINKSSLKTPNAPHCYNNIIVLLGWLADFSKVDDEPIQCRTTELMPDVSLVTMFMEQTAEAYKLFNEERDYTHLEKTIKESYVERRTGRSVDIDMEIQQLKIETDQLRKEMKPLSFAKELNIKKAEATALDEKITGHNKNIGDCNRKIANLKSTLSYKQQAQESAQNDIMSLNQQLRTQLMSQEQRQQVLIEITHLKSALMSKRNAIVELNEASSENEIILSNLISKKFQLIEQLNNMLYKLSSDLEVAGSKEEFEPQLYEIKSSKEDQSLQNMISNMHQGLAMLKSKYYEVHAAMKEYKMKLDAETHLIKTKNEMLEVRYQQILKSFEEAEENEALAEEQLSSLVHSIQINYTERKEKIKQNEKLIMERTKGIEELENELKELQEKREHFGVKAVEECQKMYLERKEQVESRRNFLRENIRAIDEYHRTKEPVPQHLLGLLNEIKNKKKRENLKEEIENAQ